MTISPLKQAVIIDVTDWELDSEFGVFPQGARAKDAVFSPCAPSDEVITPNKRYAPYFMVIRGAAHQWTRGFIKQGFECLARNQTFVAG